MPYRSIGELPDNIKDNLPKHAQEIYKAAFNNAWQQYANPKTRKSADDRETVAHKVAWEAVKQKYQKGSDGKWHEK